jgi:hypothetical protein
MPAAYAACFAVWHLPAALRFAVRSWSFTVRLNRSSCMPVCLCSAGHCKIFMGHLSGAAAQCWQVLSIKWPYGRRRCAHARICLWRLKTLTVVVLASASAARSASSVHHRVTAPQLCLLITAGLSAVTGRSHLSAVRNCARRRVQLHGRHGKLPRSIFRSTVTPSFLAPNFRAKIKRVPRVE